MHCIAFAHMSAAILRHFLSPVRSERSSRSGTAIAPHGSIPWCSALTAVPPVVCQPCFAMSVSGPYTPSKKNIQLVKYTAAFSARSRCLASPVMR